MSSKTPHITEMDSDSMGNTLRHNLANLARILAAPEN